MLHQGVDIAKDFGDRMRDWTGAAWEKGYSQRAPLGHRIQGVSQPSHYARRQAVQDRRRLSLQAALCPGNEGDHATVAHRESEEGGRTARRRSLIVAWAFERRSRSGRSLRLHRRTSARQPRRGRLSTLPDERHPLEREDRDSYRRRAGRIANRRRESLHPEGEEMKYGCVGLVLLIAVTAWGQDARQGRRRPSKANGRRRLRSLRVRSCPTPSSKAISLTVAAGKYTRPGRASLPIPGHASNSIRPPSPSRWTLSGPTGPNKEQDAAPPSTRCSKTRCASATTSKGKKRPTDFTTSEGEAVLSRRLSTPAQTLNHRARIYGRGTSMLARIAKSIYRRFLALRLR